MDTSNKKVSKAKVKIGNYSSFNTVCFYQWAVQVIFLFMSIMMLVVRCNILPNKYTHDK